MARAATDDEGILRRASQSVSRLRSHGEAALSPRHAVGRAPVWAPTRRVAWIPSEWSRGNSWTRGPGWRGSTPQWY